MGVARKRYSPDEKALILQLNREGYTYKQIAEKVRPGVSTAWRSVGEIVREAKAAEAAPPVTATPATSGLDAPVAQLPRPLVQVPTAQKGVQLPPELKDSITAREIMAMLADDQREVFVATYQDLRGEADEDTVTKAENEMLMRAALAHTQYLRAARMYSECETYLLADLNGEIPDPQDPRKRMAGRGDAYKKEMETKHKEYMELMDGLKLKRSQRLDKIKDTRNTFLDLQQSLMEKVRKTSIVEDIKRINMQTREELQRLAKGEEGPDGKQYNWLIGAFDEVTPIKEEKDERNPEDAPEGEQREGVGPEVPSPTSEDSRTDG